MDTHEKCLRLAIEEAIKSVTAGQTPFGAVIAKADEIVAATHNTVWLHNDPTAHAEVNAIREACRRLKTIDLSGYALYSSCEPCPMCFTAIHWARLDAVYYSATIEDSKSAGFNELCISNTQMKEQSRSPVKIYGPLLKEEGIRPFQLFIEKSGKCVY